MRISDWSSDVCSSDLWQRSHAARDARQLCDEGGDAARRREARGADRLLLLDRLGGVDRAAGDRRHLHQQLAARTVDRQPADAGEYPLVARLRRHPDRRRRGADLGLGLPAPPRRHAARRRGQGPADASGADPVAALARQISVRGAGAVHLPGVHRRLHRALHDRGAELLRHRCVAVVPLCADPHLARAERRSEEHTSGFRSGGGALLWGWAYLRRHDDTPLVAADKDPLTLAALTPSQRSLGKYLFVVLALFIFQVFIGGFTAHYTIEGQSFYGIDVSQWFPYALTRTWHVQSAVLWIATAFLAAGLFLAPVIQDRKSVGWGKEV